MNAEQVDKALQQKFVHEGERLVFWHDEDEEFGDYVAAGLTGELADVQVLDVAAVGGLTAKLRLEREDRAGKYLIYTHGERAPAEHDWLLDVRIYSAEFHADVASLWQEELGLEQLSLRGHLKERSAFLRSQDRRSKLKKLVEPTHDAAELDLAMIAVLAGSPIASVSEVLRSLCHRHVQDDAFDLTEPPDALATMEKMGLADRFWGAMRAEFGYEAETPTVAGLVRRLLLSELAHETADAAPSSLAHHVLPRTARNNAVVFLTGWRDSSAMAGSYDAAARAVAEEQKVGEALKELPLEALQPVFTFADVEQFVLGRLKRMLLDQSEAVDVELVADAVQGRQAGHWLAGPGRDDADIKAWASSYRALLAAAKFFVLQRETRPLLKGASAPELLQNYREQLCQLDRLYRDFCLHAKPASARGWNLLKDLADEVERAYAQGFLKPFGVEWSRLLDEGFLSTWSIEKMTSQQDFYRRTIAPYVAESGRKRAFVIISDAFRYEAATELLEQLNGTFGVKAELGAMLGVLPSYTSLGMASLLPHERLGYRENGDVQVDGKSAAGTEARGKQLATVEGIALLAANLLKMTTDEAREAMEDTRVVYIYHNVIDARGDTKSTESETFDAVTQCIQELGELVGICVKKMNASNVWVTADHGFLYQEADLDEVDKSQLSHKPEHAVTSKKRYVIGRDLGASPEAHHGKVEVSGVSEGEMEFWVPRANNRFHFTGGARFVHGGAMPQEVLVPLVTVTRVRKDVDKTRSQKVGVQVLGSSHKITTPTYRFELIQVEAVSDRCLPLSIKAAVYDGAEPVTSIESVTFDSSSQDLDDRKKTLKFELRSGTFDKHRDYRLVLRDAETEAEVASMPVVIDRSFDDDF